MSAVCGRHTVVWSQTPTTVSAAKPRPTVAESCVTRTCSVVCAAPKSEISSATA